MDGTDGQPGLKGSQVSDTIPDLTTWLTITCFRGQEEGKDSRVERATKAHV